MPCLLGFIFLAFAATSNLPAQTTFYWDVNGATAGAGGATPSGNWRTSGAGVNWSTAADGTAATALWSNGNDAVFSADTDATGSYTVTVSTVTANSILIEEGTLLFNSSTITLTGAHSVTVASGLTATFASGIAGTAGFAKEGSGTVIFQGTGKNFTGDLDVNAGTLRLGAGNMIGNAVDLNVASGATFDLNGNTDTLGSIAGDGSLTLGAGTLTIDGDGETTEFSGVISGSGGLTKTGTDTLILSGANTYDGTTAVNTGILNIRHSAALGSTVGGTTVTSGEELQLQGNIAVGAEALSITGSGASTTGALHNISGDNSFAGQITLTGNSRITSDAGSLTLTGGIVAGGSSLTLAGAGDISLSGTSTGNGSLTKLDAGTLTLGGTNNSTGATVIGVAGGTATGTVRLGSDDGLASGTLTNYASILDLNNHNDTIGALTLGGGAAGTNATVTTGTGTLTLGGNVTYSATNNADGATISGNLALGGANRTFNVGNSTAVADDLTVDAVISGSNAIIKSGTGTLVLAGANTYTGTTTVSGGVLNIRNSAALGDTAAGTTVNSGYTLELQGGIAVGNEALSITGSGYGAVGALRNVAGDNSWAGAVTLTNTTQISSDAGSLTLSGGITGAGSNRNLTLNGAGDFSIGAITTGSGTLTKNGSGTTTLTGTNTYTGDTTINAGTLRLDTGATLADTTDVVLAIGATFDVNGQTDTVATLAGGTAGVGGTVAINGGSLTTAGNGSTTFSGQFTGGGSFTKQGTGALTLDSTTDFAFDGTFNLAAGTLRLSDLNLTITTLNITGTSIIDFTGVSSLNVTTLNINGGVTLTIQNWANASDYFFAKNWTGASFDTTGTDPMAQVVFSGVAGNTKWLGYENNPGSGFHQITPVPEPSTYGAVLLAAAGGLLAWRRRISRPDA